MLKIKMKTTPTLLKFTLPVMAASLFLISPSARAQGAGENITWTIQSGLGQDWSLATGWSDQLSAAASYAQNTNNTYEIPAGKRLRAPGGGDTSFPSSLAVSTDTTPPLTVDGNSPYDKTGNANGEIRFKGNTGALCYFPNLILNGGQLNPSPSTTPGYNLINGNVNVIKKSFFYGDGNNDRGFQIFALLQGSADLEVHQNNGDGSTATYQSGIYVDNTNNTFSGNWNVVSGTLVGGSRNSLGTGGITISNNAQFEVYYDMHNTNAGLVVIGAGQVYLHQNLYFDHAVINGTPLSVGTHTAADLANQFPNNFPANWTQSIKGPGETQNSPGVSSGSLTVYSFNSTPIAITAPPANALVLTNQNATFTIQISGPASFVQWYSNNVIIPGATNLTYITPPATLANNGDIYKVLLGNNINSTNASATLVVTSLVSAPGFLADSVWFSSGTNVYDQTVVQSTPNAPTLTRYLATFQTPVNQGANYGEQVSGTFIPPVTTNYVFFIASDDGSSLYLSTNSSATNKLLIAQETGWSNPLQWVTSAGGSDTSAKRSDSFSGTMWPVIDQNSGQPVIKLTAGTPYYIEADHTQVGGGDNLAVTYIIAGNPDPVDGSASAFTPSQLSTLALAGASFAITNQPANVTTNEGKVVTFRVGIQLTNTISVFYQWYRIASGGGGGIAIPGATLASYTTPPLDFNTDNGSHFFVQVTVPGGTTGISTTNTVTVIPDTQPAIVVAVPGTLMPVGTEDPSITNQFEVSVIYSKQVQVTQATNLANFAASGGGVVVGARYLVNSMGFDNVLPASIVTVSNWNQGGSYTLTVSGITDTHNNPFVTTNLPVTISRFSWMPLGDTNTPGTYGLTFDATMTGSNSFNLVNTGFGFANGALSDDVTFVYELKTNSFDVIAQVPHMDPAGAVSVAGIMARDCIVANYLTDPSAPLQAMLVEPYILYDGTTNTPDQIGPYLRTADGATLGLDYSYAVNVVDAPPPNVWVRLRRVLTDTNDTFYLLQSTNGVKWDIITTHDFATTPLSSVLAVGPVFGAAVGGSTGNGGTGAGAAVPWAQVSDWVARIQNYVDFVPSSFTISNVANSHGTVSFKFQTQIPLTYTVLYETNLMDNAWQVLQTVPGINGLQTVTDTNSATSRFYKVSAQ